MDFGVPEAVQEAIESVVERRSYGYAWPVGSTGVPEAFAAYVERRFGWSADPARVRVTTDVVQGVAACVHAFSRPGDGVVVQTPAYPPLLRVVERLGRRLVENPLRDDGARFTLDVDGLREIVDERTRVVLFCTPHNPTGRVFDAQELAALRDLVLERDLVVVSDEIHADLVYPPRRHVPLALFDPELARRTVTVTSATKSYNLAGLRCAVACFGAEELLAVFDAAVPAELVGQVTNISRDATIAAWRDGDDWLADVLAILEQNRTTLVERLERDVPGARCHEPDATYLAWVDCSGVDAAGGDPLAFFLERGRVALKGGLDFGPPGARCVRVNFATTPDVLDEILERLAEAVAR
jgi:cystathionine beta-lyase